VLLAAAATLDATPVLVLDSRDDAVDPTVLARLDDLVVALAPAGVVRVWGSAAAIPQAVPAHLADAEHPDPLTALSLQETAR